MIGKILTLRGVSRKGKNRINEHGERWIVMSIRDSIVTSQRCGPWLLVGSQKGKLWDARWIQQNDDLNFKIINII